MILDAILIALTEIASVEQRSVAILPEMRIPRGDEVQIVHPISGYELWLIGNVNYAIIEYDNVMDNKGKSSYQPPSLRDCLMAFSDRLLAPGGSRDDALDISKGRLLLVEAKRQSLEQSLISYIPEAVSQAIALLKSAK
jgi:hypothetical protein